MLIDAVARGTDKHGSGHFGASRGSRTHKGVDIACYPGSSILSVRNGVVSKIGYPYDPNDKVKGHLRYIQITQGNINFRYFYVKTDLTVGNIVEKNQIIGVAQGLDDIYPGITEHIHFEVKENGKFVDPMTFI